MQFTRENAEKVMASTKTQTRRAVKEGERLLIGPFDIIPNRVRGDNRRLKWEVSKKYAVCPGRGKPAIGRVKLLSIRKEKLQDISEEDARAEGCVNWIWKEDGATPKVTARLNFKELWDSINPKGKRWDDNPDVWALTFEVVR